MVKKVRRLKNGGGECGSGEGKGGSGGSGGI